MKFFFLPAIYTQPFPDGPYWRSAVRKARGSPIIWHLLADPTARYQDLGAGYYASRINNDRKLKNHIRQIQALGYAVTLTQAA